jgi:glycogen debranching enzyme
MLPFGNSVFRADTNDDAKDKVLADDKYLKDLPSKTRDIDASKIEGDGGKT